MSSTGPRLRVSSRPSHAAGASKDLRSHTMPSKPARPDSSHGPGWGAEAHAVSSNSGACHPAAEPGSFLRYQASLVSAASPPARMVCAVERTPATASVKSGSGARPSALAQASQIVPPQEEWMRPIGTLRSRCSSRPKK